MEKINRQGGKIEIEAVIDSLNGINRAEAPPFFYTRLQAKLQRQIPPSIMEKVIGFFAQPVFALTSLSLFVLMNIYAITSIVKEKKQTVSGVVTTGTSIQSFAQEYDLSNNTLYNDSKNN